MSDFVHLHTHSHYSLLRGLPKVKALVKAAKDRGFTALALTDYGAMYGAIEFYQTCRGLDIKPIIGFEAYVARRSRHDKDREHDRNPYHLVLLAENYDGYRQLMRLSSLGHTEGWFDGRPRVDLEALREHSGHIIALSGCLSGEVPQLLKDGKHADARAAAARYAEIFGPDRFYLELEDHPAISGQLAVNTALIQLAKDTGLPLVVTRDVHYLDPADAEAQDILVCIGEGAKVDQPTRESFRQTDRSLATESEIASRFRHVPEAIANTRRIADRVDMNIPLHEWHFAPVELPPGRTANELLCEQARVRVAQYYSPVTPQVQERLEYELKIICDKGYSPYFLCVADFVRYAKEHGIVETTRGSAAGSVVSYVLGITTVDPLRFQLPFERFLTMDRPTPPDIDTDFADNRREEMIEYVTDKYGKDKVAQIITFGTMAARASVRDVGRVLGFSYSFCDQVAKLIPIGAQGFPMTITRAVAEEPDLKKLYETNADVKRLLDLAKKVEGCARHTSIHAAGVVIAPTPLTDFTPIQFEVGGTRLTTQYEMKSVEAAGLLKMDFLGIRNLSILGTAVEIVEKTTGEQIDIYSLPLDDAATFAMLSRGETMGTFQLGGSGMTRWLKELKPTTIDDIMAMVALYRPGPMDAIPEYIRRKHHPELVEHLDPRMEKYLKASFGLLVYQDDVLTTAIELAGYDWAEADNFRRAIGKKIPAEMEKQKIKFFLGCRDHAKLPEDKIEELWRRIEPFAAYGFNKAHAASYGIVAYQTSYLKAHYPVQYMTAVLQEEADDADKVAAIAHECRRMGIAVLPPDVNESFRNFAIPSTHSTSSGQALLGTDPSTSPSTSVSGSAEDRGAVPNRIRFGLTAIKNVGEHICNVIYEERKRGGQYASIENFLERVQDKDLNKKSLESLVQVGAFDSFGLDRGALMANSETMLSFARQARAAKSDQHSLFAGTTIGVANKLSLAPTPPATMAQMLTWEKQLLGLYVSAHPFADYAEALGDALVTAANVSGVPRDSWVSVGGVVGKLTRKLTKKGAVMLFATLEDVSGSVEILVFPKTLEQTLPLWQPGAVLCVVGRMPREEGDTKVFAEHVYAVTPDNVRAIRDQLRLGRTGSSLPESQHQTAEPRVVFALTKEELTRHTDALKQIFSDHPGATPVYLRVGESMIRTKSKIQWDTQMEREITGVIGENKVWKYA